jgi:hypothetical protein
MTKYALFPTDDKNLSKRSKMQETDRQALEPIVQNSMFFTMLNLNVRMTIDDFLYEWLPSLPYRKRWGREDDCRGMVLSWKQANGVCTHIGGDPMSVVNVSQELSEAAARHLKLLLDQFSVSFEKHHEHPIKLYGSVLLHQGWQALRSVTLSLDIGFFDEALAKIANLSDKSDDSDDDSNPRAA